MSAIIKHARINGKYFSAYVESNGNGSCDVTFMLNKLENHDANISKRCEEMRDELHFMQYQIEHIQSANDLEMKKEEE